MFQYLLTKSRIVFWRSSDKNIGLVGAVSSGKTSFLLASALELGDASNTSQNGAITLNGSHLIQHFTSLLDDNADIIPSNPNDSESIEFDNFGKKYVIKDIGGEAFNDLSESNFNRLSDLFTKIDALIFIIDGQPVENRQAELTYDIELFQKLAEFHSKNLFKLRKRFILFLVNKSDLWNKLNHKKKTDKIATSTQKLFQIPINTFRSSDIHTEIIPISSHKLKSDGSYNPYERRQISDVLKIIFERL